MKTQYYTMIDYNKSTQIVTIYDYSNLNTDVDNFATYKRFQIISKAEYKKQMLKNNVLNLMQDCFIYKSNSEINV